MPCKVEFLSRSLVCLLATSPLGPPHWIGRPTAIDERKLTENIIISEWRQFFLLLPPFRGPAASMCLAGCRESSWLLVHSYSPRRPLNKFAWHGTPRHHRCWASCKKNDETTDNVYALLLPHVLLLLWSVSPHLFAGHTARQPTNRPRDQQPQLLATFSVPLFPRARVTRCLVVYPEQQQIN